MGFDAIWISPVVDNYANGYHGYWAQNWEEVNNHFGSEQDLIDLVMRFPIWLITKEVRFKALFGGVVFSTPAVWI